MIFEDFLQTEKPFSLDAAFVYSSIHTYQNEKILMHLELVICSVTFILVANSLQKYKQKWPN